MKLNLHAIPQRGLKLVFSRREAWLAALIDDCFKESDPQWNTLQASLDVNRLDRNVMIEGEINIELNPTCDRCLESFASPLQVPIHMALAPLYASAKDREKSRASHDERELSKEDLDFSFYENDEINLEPILREALVLSLPQRALCSEQCLGLCPQCGTNQNTGHCQCTPEGLLDPRLSVLKNFSKSLK